MGEKELDKDFFKVWLKEDLGSVNSFLWEKKSKQLSILQGTNGQEIEKSCNPGKPLEMVPKWKQPWIQKRRGRTMKIEKTLRKRGQSKLWKLN